MPIARNTVDPEGFNGELVLPYQLRIDDFRLAMTDVYDFFFDVNEHLTSNGLRRLDDMLRAAIMSGVLSDMLTASLATHARALVENQYFNGHPDLVVRGIYPQNSVQAGDSGVEVKNDAQQRGRGRYPRGQRPMDVRVCLRDRHGHGACNRTTPDDLHQNLSGPSYVRRLPEKPSRGTGNKDRHPASGRDRQTTPELGVSSLTNAIYRVRGQLRYCFPAQ